MLLYFNQKLFDLHVLTSLYVQLHTDTEWSFATWLLFRTKFSKSSEIYYKLGQFQYNHSYFTPGPIQQSIYEINDNKVIYIGQLKEGTDIKEGIGIRVASNGDIFEGCWKNGEFNGIGSLKPISAEMTSLLQRKYIKKIIIHILLNRFGIKIK